VFAGINLPRMKPVKINTFNTTRYQAILDSLNDLVVVLDHNCQIAYANMGFLSSKLVLDFDIICELFEEACPLQQKTIKRMINHKAYQIKLSYLPHQEGILVVLSPDLDAMKNAIKVASHDFKTPLTSLKLQAQLMKKAYAQDNSSVSQEKVHSLLELTERQTNRLNVLVELMLKNSGI
jgi:K+-sensing histidine kinase KdpD